MKITKNELTAMVKQLVEEAKANIGIDKSMVNAVIKGLEKVKTDKLDLREELSPAQFDEFNKALNKIYTILDEV